MPPKTRAAATGGRVEKTSSKEKAKAGAATGKTKKGGTLEKTRNGKLKNKKSLGDVKAAAIKKNKGKPADDTCVICRGPTDKDGMERENASPADKAKYGPDVVRFCKGEHGIAHPVHDGCCARWMETFPLELRHNPLPNCLKCFGPMDQPFPAGTESFEIAAVAKKWLQDMESLKALSGSTLGDPSRFADFRKLCEALEFPNVPGDHGSAFNLSSEQMRLLAPLVTDPDKRLELKLMLFIQPPLPNPDFPGLYWFGAWDKLASDVDYYWEDPNGQLEAWLDEFPSVTDDEEYSDDLDSGS